MANKVTIKPNASDLDLQATNNQVIVDGQTLDPNSVGVNLTNQQLDLQIVAVPNLQKFYRYFLLFLEN